MKSEKSKQSLLIRNCAKYILLFSLIFLFMSSFGYLEAKWIWTKKTGFINMKKFQTGAPKNIFEKAVTYLQNKSYEKAAEMFLGLSKMLRGKENEKLRAKCYYLAGKSYYAGREYYKAYEMLKYYLAHYPKGEDFNEAVKLSLDAGLQLLSGAKREYAGIKIFTARDEGKKIIKEILKKYPYTDYSEKYKLAFADELRRQNALDEAIEQYKEFVQIYPQSDLKSIAQVKLGECQMKKYKGPNYDYEPLYRAKETADKIENRESQSIKSSFEVFKEKVTDNLGKKDWEVAEYYLKSGKKQSAIFYYKNIIKNHPNTEWAKRSSEKLLQLGVDVTEKTPAKQEKLGAGKDEEKLHKAP